MKVKINKLQYFFLIPNLVYGKAVGITAGVFVRNIGSDTWSSMSIGFITGTLFAIIMTYLGSKFQEETVIQYSEKLLGKWPGKLIGLILAVYFIIAYGFSANVIMLHIKEYLLLETPTLILVIIYTVLCLYGVILGIEVIIRFSLFGFLMILAININMMIGTIKDFRLQNLRPFLDMGIAQNMYNSIYAFSDVSMAILTIAMIFPMLNNKNKVYKTTFWSMMVGAIIVLIWPFFETGVMGADVMKQFVVVCMQQVRCAQLTRYLPRYELIMVIFFVWGVFVQSAVMFYLAVFSFKQITGIKKDWKIGVAITPALIVLTYYIGIDHNNYIKYIAFPWTQICALLSMGLPMLLLIAYGLKKIFAKKNRALKSNA